MKVHPDKFQQVKSSRYQDNLQEIAKPSNSKQRPSNRAPTDEFNLTFLVKDYDQTNPYLNKHSLTRGKMSKRQRQTEENVLFEQSLLNVSPIGGSIQLNQKSSDGQQLKLPNIGNNVHNIHNKQKHKGNKVVSGSKGHPSTNQSHQKIMRYNKSATIDTRLQTDDISVEAGSFSTLLKMNSNVKSIDSQPFSCLKISKIVANPQMQENKDFLQRYNLLSRDVSDQSLQISPPVSPCKRKVRNVIVEQDSTSECSEDEEYIKQSSPGPGYYTIAQHSLFSVNKNKRNNSISLDFGSRQARFKSNNNVDLIDDSLTQEINRQEYQERQKRREERLVINKRQRKHIPFNSKEQPIKSIFEKNQMEKMISPVYYNPRDGIEEELIKKIQKNFKDNFGVEEKRFKTLYRKKYNLGPGSYNLDINNNNGDEQKRPDHFFISKKDRFQQKFTSF